MTMPASYNNWRLDAWPPVQGGIPVPDLNNPTWAGRQGLSDGARVPGLRWYGHTFTSNGDVSFPEVLGTWVYLDWAIRAVVTSNGTQGYTDDYIAAKETPGWITSWRFYIDTDGQLTFYVLERGGAESQTLTSGFAITDGVTHDCAVRKVGYELELIVDGQVVDTATMIVNGFDDEATFVIGNRYGGGYGFSGVIESFETWFSLHTDIPTVADFAEAAYFNSSMTLGPVDPYRGQAEVSPSADTKLEFWIYDAVNVVQTVSLNVNVMIPDEEKIIIRNGVPEPSGNGNDFVVTYTPSAGVGLHVLIEWGPADYQLPWNTEVPIYVFTTNDGGQHIIAHYLFYTPTDVVAPAFQGQIPADLGQRVSTTTALYFELWDETAGIDESTLLLEIDKHGNRAYETIYSGGSFQAPYTGSVVADGVEGIRQYNVTVDTLDLGVDAPIYIRADVYDYAGNRARIRYWFRTVEVAEDIAPEYPVDQENLVSTGESLALDFKFEDPLTVTVGGVLAYDDGLVPKFRNGWGGAYIDDDNGKRLILEPPTPFTINANVTVSVTTASYARSYTFRVSSQQITTTSDVTGPKITEATAANVWIGYVRSGNLVLRKGDPLTGEVTVIPARQWDHGYDPTLGKYLLYWIDNGRVFYSAADPGDAPEVLPEYSTINGTITEALGGSESVYIKTRLTARPQDPIVKGVPPDGVLDIDIYRPTTDPSADQLVGFNLYTLWHGTASLIKYVVADPTDPTTYLIPDYILGSQYFVRPVYDRGGELLEGASSDRVGLPDYSSLASESLAGSEGQYVFGSTTFPPLKFFVPDNVAEGLAGDEALYVFRGFRYETSKETNEETPDNAAEGLAGSESMAVVLIGGFGIIGVG